ncbi:MAG: hypothetical protein H6962_10380 [Chromatiaceae bacterium]|nr:hypothetical protein [Chromatiaceae bacterium]
MTSKDKTGDQLVASIRRTKAAATKTNATAAPAKAATRTRSAARQSKGAKAGKAATDVSAGYYQAGRRVWPD